ncbi:hypothetical protein G7046_g3160 [Stylonectria norvegica]|nr:hypothetical protein G7046_g3160 [Stylonectria norvegica]
MSSSFSPEQSEVGSGAAGSGAEDKDGLSSLNLDFLKSLTEKKPSKDGTPQKKRGPKPNSKPALTRRQELNRQAQRTHRERKEMYIKALEDEVLRLKESFSQVSLCKEKLAQENQQLKATLSHGGMHLPSPGQTDESTGYASSTSMSGGHIHGNSRSFTPTMTLQSTATSESSPNHSFFPNEQQPMGGHQLQNSSQQAVSQGGVDLDEAGIDFVLTLERPCMAHLPWMMNRTAETGHDPCGHALMASCPPGPFTALTPDIPFGASQVHGKPSAGQPTWELSKSGLSTLLDLSARLDLDGEITPVMAWGLILANARLRDLQVCDLQRVSLELAKKTRCYGFGAVLEEFELRDALENVLIWKPETMAIDLRTPGAAGLATFFGRPGAPHPTPPQIHRGYPNSSITVTKRSSSPPSPTHAQQHKMTDSLDYVKICESCPPGDGWGPSVTTETTLNGVPYAPFSKGDKLGRMADWTTEGKEGTRGGRQQYNRNYRDQQVYGASNAITFIAPPAEDESSFSVVSNARESTKSRYGRGAIFTRGRGQRGGRGNDRGGRGGGGQLQRTGDQQQTGRGGRGAYGYDRGGRPNAGGRGGRRFGWKDYDKPARNRDASVNIKAEWKLLEEIDFNRLAKLNLDADEGEDIDDYGFLYYYDRTYDKAPVKGAEKKLVAVDRASYNVTTSSDPIIQELAEKDEGTIFATDSILSMLMCSPRSVYPWDIVIVRQGNKVFLDKRDNATLDLVTVNENAADAPLDAADGSKDTVNQPNALAEEATYINHNFANQVVSESETNKVEMTHGNPFYNSSEDTDPPASKAYKYRRFDLSTNDEEPVYLVVRTEVDAVQRNAISGEDQYMTIKALNEFDSKAQGSGGALDWRSKLVAQRGAVVATEMKNNSCKLARWTVQSILSKSDVMKLGFVSRVNPKLNDKHVVLGVVGWKPRDFANQMNLSLSNGWGIVRTIADMCLNSENEDAKFVLVKDPNKQILRLYEVPTESFDDDDEDDGDDEDEADEAAADAAEK